MYFTQTNFTFGLRNANEMLQTSFDRKRLYFAASAMDENYSLQKAKKYQSKI